MEKKYKFTMMYSCGHNVVKPTCQSVLQGERVRTRALCPVCAVQAAKRRAQASSG